MRLASLEPMQAVPISERPLKPGEVKPRGAEDPHALAEPETSPEGEGAPQKQKHSEEGFVRFVEFIRRQGRQKERNPKTRKGRMLAAYHSLENAMVEGLSRGGKFDKAG